MSSSPYPGLRSFTRSEDKFFFGRDEQIDVALEKLRHTRFLPVVGPSGCGKSSLIRAGLMASLEGGLMDEVGSRWEMAEMRPGKYPFAGLSDALLKEESFRTRFDQLKQGPAEMEARAGFLRAELRQSPQGLCEILERNGLPRGTNFLLLVDQFEEIFVARREGNVEDADAFVAMLLATAAQRELPVYIIITMRTDYLGDCTVFSGLAEEINRTFFLTPRLTREQRSDAISEPTRLMGGVLDRELLNQLLNQSENSADDLPLLQHLLMRMWTLAKEESDAHPEHGGKVHLTADHCAMAGGLKKALSVHAGTAYGELDARQQQIAEVLFRALSEISSDKRERRRLVTVQEVADLAGPNLAGVTAAEVGQVAEVFRRPGRDFLVASPEQQLTAESILDISHEALIRNWDTLRKWAKAEAESAETYLDLERAARKYEEGRAGLLDRLGTDLNKKWIKQERPTSKWAARYGGDFPEAIAFLRRCERRQNWKRVRRYAIACLALSIAGIFWKVYFRYRMEEEFAARAVSEDSVSKGLARLESGAYEPKADAFALRDLGRALKAWPENPEAAKHAANLLFCNWFPPITPTLSYKPNAPLLSGSFYDDDNFYVVALDGNLLERKGNEAVLQMRQNVVDEKTLPKGMLTRLSSASFSPNGDRLVVVPASKQSGVPAVAQIWKRKGSEYIFDQQIQLSSTATEIPSPKSFIWNNDRSVLITSAWQPSGGTHDVFKLAGDTFVRMQSPFTDGLTAASFDTSGQYLAISDAKSNIQLRNAKTMGPLSIAQNAAGKQTIFSAGSQCFDLTFTHGNRNLLVSRYGGWSDINLDTGVIKSARPPTLQDQFIRFAVPSNNGNRVRFAAALANRVLFAETDVAEPNFAMLMEYPANEPLCIKGSAAMPVFNAKGTRLLTLSGNWNAMDTLRVWDLTPRPKTKPVTFDGKNAPKWLGPLAMAVSGLRGGSDDDSETVQTMMQIEQTFGAEEKREPYRELWKRYFSSK